MLKYARQALLVLCSCLAAVGVAQAPMAPETEMHTIINAGDLVPYIDAANSEILVSAYMLRVESTAEALRRAMVQRGVSVYILTTDNGLHESASYAKSLALAGAHVRSGLANAELMIIDRYYVVNGPLVGVQSMPEGMDPTFIITGQDYANNLVALFIEIYNAATVFDPTEVHLP